MGGSQSTQIPGGGTEGYHVLRVRTHEASGSVLLVSKGDHWGVILI